MSDAGQKSLPDISTYAGYAKAIHDFSINQVEQLKEIDRRIKSYDLTPDMAADGLAMAIEGFINTVIQTRLKIYEASQPTHKTDIPVLQQIHPVDSKLHDSVGLSPVDGEIERVLKNYGDYRAGMYQGGQNYDIETATFAITAHLQAAVHEAFKNSTNTNIDGDAKYWSGENNGEAVDKFYPQIWFDEKFMPALLQQLTPKEQE